MFYKTDVTSFHYIMVMFTSSHNWWGLWSYQIVSIISSYLIENRACLNCQVLSWQGIVVDVRRFPHKVSSNFKEK